MVWLSVAGAVFLVWLVAVVLFTPAINYHLSRRTSVHDARLPLHDPVDLPGGAPPRQPRRDLHQRPALLPGDARRHPRRDAIDQHGAATSFSPARSPTSSSTRCRSARGTASTSRSSSTRIGSFSLWGRPVRRLREAGCRIESYQRLRWYSLARLNNRTHRELLIVDGRIAFAGGAGIADWWRVPRQAQARPWRDTMARIEGPGRRGAAGRGGGELAGVLRRDPHRPGVLPRPAAGGRHDGVRRQELALRSRDDVARRRSSC